MFGSTYLTYILSIFLSVTSSPRDEATTTICNGQKYTYIHLTGFGSNPPNARDKYGDTAGGLGSSIAIDPQTWRRDTNGEYQGTLYSLPDRGWNTKGTLNYQSRIHIFNLTFRPDQQDGTPNLELLRKRSLPQLRRLPAPPSSNIPRRRLRRARARRPPRKLALDSESLVLDADGTFWAGDEYGPYIYHFSREGLTLDAIRPPEAYIPKRNGSDSFASDNAPIYDLDRTVIPSDGPTGRHNNQGFEGLTASHDGKTLYALLQSATNRDGGIDGQGRNKNRYTRLLQYDKATRRLQAEYIVPLPLYTSSSGRQTVVAQSEFKYISPTQFLVLARDEGYGRAQNDTRSRYRHVDVVDLTFATNTRGMIFTVAPRGELFPELSVAMYCPWLDFNNNEELAWFGLHNGGAQDRGLLNEKWESLALLPVLDGDGAVVERDGGQREWFLLSLSDDDFRTQDGYMDFGRYRYSDGSGFDVAGQMLVFRVALPGGLRPRVG